MNWYLRRVFTWLFLRARYSYFCETLHGFGIGTQLLPMWYITARAVLMSSLT
jgi:hypothetical protein